MRQTFYSFTLILSLLFLSSLAVPVQAKPSANIDLSYFRLTAEDNGVGLEWRTETEFGTVGYYIKRSANGGDYTLLTNFGIDGFIEATGGDVPTTYTELDDSAVRGTAYNYQLIEIESDGKETEAASQFILFADSPTNTPTATPIAVGLPTNTPIPATNTPVTDNSGNTVTPSPTTLPPTATPTPSQTATAVATRQATTPTATQQASATPQGTNTAAPVATMPLPTTAPTTDPLPIATATLPPESEVIDGEVIYFEGDIAYAQEGEDPYPAPGATSYPDGVETQPIAPTNDQAIEPTAYPANQATATPFSLTVIGSQNDDGTTNGDTTQAENETQGQLFLWIGFIVALLIFIVAVVGAIVLFTRQRE